MHRNRHICHIHNLRHWRDDNAGECGGDHHGRASNGPYREHVGGRELRAARYKTKQQCGDDHVGRQGAPALAPEPSAAAPVVRGFEKAKGRVARLGLRSLNLIAESVQVEVHFNVHTHRDGLPIFARRLKFPILDSFHSFLIES